MCGFKNYEEYKNHCVIIHKVYINAFDFLCKNNFIFPDKVYIQYSDEIINFQWLTEHGKIDANIDINGNVCINIFDYNNIYPMFDVLKFNIYK